MYSGWQLARPSPMAPSPATSWLGSLWGREISANPEAPLGGGRPGREVGPLPQRILSRGASSQGGVLP